MASALDDYKARLDQTIPRLETLGDAAKYTSRALLVGKKVVGQMKTAEETTKKSSTLVQVIDGTLTVLGFISPIKTPTKVLQQALKKVERSLDSVEDQFDKLNGKDDTSTRGREDDGEFLTNVETNITRASLAVAALRDTVTLRQRQLEIASEATGNFKTALAVATAVGEPWSGRYDPLNAAIEAQLAARNDLLEPLEALYADVKERVDDFIEVLETIDFEKIFGEFIDLDAIADLFDFLEKPLEIAQSVIEPILPLLNAVGALIGLIVDPVIDFVTETLGIGDLIDAATDKIEELLPSINLLEALDGLLQSVQDFLLEYIVDWLGQVDFLDAIEESFFGDVVGEAGDGPTGWGNDVANRLEGDEGDDILDALGDDDTIEGGGGDDVLVAGRGSDRLDGGPGNDLFHFPNPSGEYQILRDDATDEIIVNHIDPADAQTNTGSDTLAALDDEDHVVFADISFSGEELNDALIEPSILNGDGGDNLIFLIPAGEQQDLLFVANGEGGDDRIFGTFAGDRLNGGPGDDVLVPQGGDDEANGNGGRDTFQVLEGANTTVRVDLVDGTSFGGEGRDTLNSIENVVLSPGQKHTVRATDDPNAIFTGDGIDVISALGGDDTIEARGEDDYIVAGPGSDVVNAGSGGIDVMISGSAAARGVRDVYDGGDGFDVLAYTSVSNTIKFDISDQSDDPSILQTLRSFMEDQPESGPVEIRAANGIVRRFDETGTFLARDTARNVEGYVGSDMADRLFGAVGTDLLHGGGGDDVIETGGSEDIDGGDGDDLIIAQDVQDGPGTLQVEGGSGFDILSLDEVGDARWYYNVQTSIALTLRAHDTGVEGTDLRNARDVFFEIKPRSVERISLGDFDDHAIYEPGGTATAEFFLMGGNDRFDAENGFADVDAGAGNDVGNFDGGGGGIFRGGAGDDFAVFDDTTRENRALMGEDGDSLVIERFFGHADGGPGYDRIAFDVAFASRVVADLAAGTAESFKGVVTNNADQVGMTFENFEEFIATEFNDAIDGSRRDETFLGRGGADGIRGGGGRDEIFGGTGNDSLEGERGDDLLHGGDGNDRLDGGPGSDTASYAWARPGGLDGALFAGGFGAVSVDLAANVATGAFGTDVLVSIENAYGGGGNDSLEGNRGDNLLSGGRGDDVLDGEGGDDVLVTGSGNDTARGGGGADTLVVGLGTKRLEGGPGRDTLDFGTVAGEVVIDFRRGSYEGTFLEEEPRWLERDLDGDGVEESDGTEARPFDGQLLTPRDVHETNPARSDGPDDGLRRLPEPDDPAFDALRIEVVDVERPSRGSFTSIEQVVGGESGATLILTNGVERFDGRVSNRDVLDFSNRNGDLAYDMRTGATDISVLAGDDVTGIDQVIGGSGDDAFAGARGSQTLDGGRGNDTLAGAGGRDALNGEGGADHLAGGGGNDRLDGGRGRDDLAGGGGNDRLDGGRGRDDLAGGGGNDALGGGGQADRLAGGNGRDTLEGDGGRDRLDGERGHDILSGGRGADVFFHGRRGGDDVILDFEPGRDTVNLEALGLSGRELLRSASQSRDGVTGDFGRDGSLTLEGVTFRDLSADDFVI